MCTRVLVLLALQVGLSHCFSWDIVVGYESQLQFYNNGELTHTEHIPRVAIRAVTYDPVHNRVLYAFYDMTKFPRYPASSISSFDLSIKTIQPLFTRSKFFVHSLAYDPVTQLLFLLQSGDIYSFSLNPASTNKTAVDGYIFEKRSEDLYSKDITMDICGRYIYWTTAQKIWRARFDGSEKEVLRHDPGVTHCNLAFDPYTQEIYWYQWQRHCDNNPKNPQCLYEYHIKSFNVNGERNIKTVYNPPNQIFTLVVGKDFIYWGDYYSWIKNGTGVINHLPKNADKNEKAKQFFSFNEYACRHCAIIAVNYSIQEETQGKKFCDAPKSLTPNSSAVSNSRGESLLCVHGMKASGESRCKCKLGYTGDRCDIRNCQNYCFQGKCISAKGRPKCRCKPG